MGSPIFVFREVDRDRFEEVRSGIKSIETRCGKKYESVGVGDEIRLACGDDVLTKTVVKKYHWPSVEAMLAEVPLKRVMPDLENIEQAKARYASYPDYEEKIKREGILGFKLE